MMIGGQGAHAQSADFQPSPTGGVEIATDERRRGLSWSDGDAAISADLAVPVAGLIATGRVVSTRGSDRHGGADAVTDLSLGSERDVGPVIVRLRATGHLFIGATGGMDYYELGIGGRYTLGPMLFDAGIEYVPSQRAIGGDNVYLRAGVSAGIPATPFTISAGIGHSTGGTDEPARAARLRPTGDYTDWRLGIDHVRGPVTLGIDYVGTDIDRSRAALPFADRSNSGDRLLARARLSF
ncbi:hypothetical protein JAO74_11690 [Sphingomonas sp. BT553]|uniref:Porin family protein n=2 Tax=Sphingomonas mollis TaxID=2795726 RepID=A0ABS0XQZ4_9SPHN|nr:hypothetical protein [Sphingomonas sp. BT553]